MKRFFAFLMTFVVALTLFATLIDASETRFDELQKLENGSADSQKFMLELYKNDVDFRFSNGEIFVDMKSPKLQAALNIMKVVQSGTDANLTQKMLAQKEILAKLEGEVREITSKFAPALIDVRARLVANKLEKTEIFVLLDYKKLPFSFLQFLTGERQKAPFSAEELRSIYDVLVAKFDAKITIKQADFFNDEGQYERAVRRNFVAVKYGLMFAVALMLTLCVVFLTRRKTRTIVKEVAVQEGGEDELIELNYFEELAKADDGVILSVYNKAPRNDLLVALKGSGEELTSRFLAVIDQKQVGRFLRDLENVGEVTLKDVLEAQRRVFDLLD